MPEIKYSGTIRPDKMNERQVLNSLNSVIKFLEINGMSKEAREHLGNVERLEATIKQGVFKN